MNVNKWYCDHCGKELNNMKDYIDIEIDTAYDHSIADLCQDCVKKLWEVISDFCSVQKDNKMSVNKGDDCNKHIDDTPNVDIIEIVRCKDCKLRTSEKCAMYYCSNCGGQHTWGTDNDFCSYGERKDG